MDNIVRGHGASSPQSDRSHAAAGENLIPGYNLLRGNRL
jgi:hypothetical protein